MTRALPALVLRRAIAIALGLLGAVLSAEAALRAWPPNVLLASATFTHIAPNGRLAANLAQFDLDAELGYRPRPRHPDYGPHGALENSYALDKPPGVHRTILLGDSVIHRGELQSALRGLEAPSSPGEEYWGLGVEGYTTDQELALYRRYGPGLSPDRVALFFSHNDLVVTPIFFETSEGQLLCFHPASPRPANRKLLRWSRLYLLALASTSAERDGTRQLAALADTLAQLAAEVEQDGAELVVLVQPLLLPEAPASTTEGRKMLGDHERVLQCLADLQIPTLDLEPLVQTARDARLPLATRPSDVNHPSPQLARLYAAELVRRFP